MASRLASAPGLLKSSRAVWLLSAWKPGLWPVQQQQIEVAALQLAQGDLRRGPEPGRSRVYTLHPEI